MEWACSMGGGFVASAILHTCLQGFSHVMQSTRVYWWVTLHVAPTFEWFPPDMELWLWLMPPSQVSGWCTLIPNLGHAKLPGNRDQVSQSLTWLGGGGGAQAKVRSPHIWQASAHTSLQSQVSAWQAHPDP